MPILQVLLVLVLAGILLWVVNTYLAAVIDAKILKIINVVFVVVIVLWLVSLFFGGFGSLNTIRVGR